MNAKLREPVELEPEAPRKVRRQQGGRDGDDCEAGAGRAIAGQERWRIEGPVRASKPGSHDLDHERDIGAARAAEGEKRAAHRRARIGGRLSIGVDRPAWGQGLAAIRVAPELDKGCRARGLVDQQRRAFIERSGERDRVGAIDGRLRPGDRHQCRPACRSERNQAGLRQTARIVPEFARGVAAVLGEQREAEALGAAAKIVEDAIDASWATPPLASQWIAAGAGDVTRGSALPTIRPARKAVR